MRSGNNFTAYASSDGVNWVTATGASISINMAPNAYVGLIVSSATGPSLGTGTFDNVSIDSAAAPAPLITTVSATTASAGATVVIYGRGFGAQQSNSAVRLNGSSVTINSWSATSISFTVPTSLGWAYLVVSVAPSMNNSNPVIFTVTNTPLPSPWLDRDVGWVGGLLQIGNANYTSPTFTVTGAGVGLSSGAADSMHFVYQPLSGDGTIIARVASTSGAAVQAGVIIRETMDAGSRSMAVVSQYGSISSVYRVNPNTNGTSVGGGGTAWVKLTRTSRINFIAYYSSDGTVWTQIGAPQTIDMAPNVYWGLVVSSTALTLSTATFDNLSGTIGTIPFVTGLSPSLGGVGTNVTITGLSFGATQGTSTVTFNGTLASPTWDPSGTRITAPVPSGATTGPVVVTVGGTPSISNNLVFTVIPTVLTLSPSAGGIGTLITVTGTAFGAMQGGSTVTLNGRVLIPNSWTDTAIQVSVPLGASSGPVVVTVGGYPSNSDQSFTLNETIFSLSPTFGPVGSLVTVLGSGFGNPQGQSTVKFNGVAATPNSWNDSTILTPVPASASTGPVVVTVGLTDSNSVGFTVSCAINSLSVTSGTAGTSVTISGNGFGNTPGDSTVTFNGVPAATPTWGPSSIIATVPAGASTGPVVVTVSGISSNAVQFTVPPTIASLSPTAGPVATRVTIVGSNFGVSTGSVIFNGTPATVITSWTPTRIVATVPPGATTGSVVVNVGTASSNPMTFTVGTGSIGGTVTGGASGIGGALVEALQANATVGSATTAPNGTYTIANLNPGTYDVRVSAAGFGTTVLAGNNVTAGATTTVNANLLTPGSIAGRVTRSDGVTAISGAAVTVHQAADTIGNVSTDTGGNYTVSSLSPGSFTVQASANGFTAQSQTGVNVSSGITTTANFSLAGQSAITYEYDELGRLGGVVDSLNGAAAYQYDAVGNLLKILTNPVTQPFIIGFTPKRGPLNASVTINGSGFSSIPGENMVTFNNGPTSLPAPVTSSTSTQIVTSVPSGAVPGTAYTIQVTSAGVPATGSPGSFTVTSGTAPTITGISPTVATQGTAITVSGTGIDPAPTSNRVLLNTTLATVTSVSANSLTTNLSPSTGSGKVTLSTAYGSIKSSQDLFVPFGYHVPADVGYTGRIPAIPGSAAANIPAGKIGLLVFDANAGQSVRLTLSGSNFSTCRLYILGPTLSQSGWYSCTAGSFFVETGILPVTGTYTIGIDPQGSPAGSISIALGLNP